MFRRLTISQSKFYHFQNQALKILQFYFNNGMRVSPTLKKVLIGFEREENCLSLDLHTHLSPFFPIQKLVHCM